MRPAYIWKVLRKDLALGPRSPIFLWAIVLPFVLTLVLQVAFGTLFDPEPRLGIVDEGDSEMTAKIEAIEGIKLAMLDDGDELRRQVESNDLDAGLIIPEGFDEALKAQRKPDLSFFVGGESYASNRLILTVIAMDMVREVQGGEPVVNVETVDLGKASLPMSMRMVPVIVFYALVIAGLFVPGASIVEEKEQGTLTAMLVTPVKVGDVLVAKWVLAVLFAALMAIVSLLLNGAMGPNWLEVIAVVLVASALSGMLGIVVGVVAKDSAILFGIVKGLGIFLFAPAIFYVFPEWPQWIAKLFPLYWIIEPIWQVSVMGESIATVWMELLIALGITAALAVAAALLTRRMQRQMAGQ